MDTGGQSNSIRGCHNMQVSMEMAIVVMFEAKLDSSAEGHLLTLHVHRQYFQAIWVRVYQSKHGYLQRLFELL